MPWKETTTMEQKIEFICEWLTGKYTITELCESFEISRPTAYKLICRSKNKVLSPCENGSRALGIHPNATSENIIDGILNLNAKHKHWGAKKIRELLFNDFTRREVPSVVTVHKILKNNGLLCPQKTDAKGQTGIPDL